MCGINIGTSRTGRLFESEFRVNVQMAKIKKLGHILQVWLTNKDPFKGEKCYGLVKSKRNQAQHLSLSYIGKS